MLNETFKRNIFFTLFIGIFIFAFLRFQVFFVEEGVVLYGFEEQNFIITNEQVFVLRGEAKKSKKLSINGKEILLNEKYQFSEKVFLSPFENIFYIESLSKTDIEFDREISIFLEK